MSMKLYHPESNGGSLNLRLWLSMKTLQSSVRLVSFGLALAAVRSSLAWGMVRSTGKLFV